MSNWGGANRPVTSNKLGSPNRREGADGDLQIRQTQLGAKLFGKIGGRWYDNPFSIDGVTKIGTNLSEHLSISSDGIEIIKADKKVAFFGSTARIGEDSTSKSALRVAADGALTIGTSNSTKFSIAAADGVTTVTDILLGGRIKNGNISNSNIVIGAENALGVTDVDGSGLFSGNVIIGDQACNAVDVGGSDTFLNNIAIGNNAMKTCDPNAADATARSNVAIGHSAMNNRDSGDNNIAVGKGAMFGVGDGTCTGAGNIAIGGGSLDVITTGDDNICIGRDAGNNITSGHDNVVIGGADVTADADDQLSISSGDGSVVWLTGDSSGNITGTGTFTCSGKIDAGSGKIETSGEVEGGSLDINGAADISGALTGLDSISQTNMNTVSWTTANLAAGASENKLLAAGVYLLIVRSNISAVMISCFNVGSTYVDGLSAIATATSSTITDPGSSRNITVNNTHGSTAQTFTCFAMQIV